MAINRIQLFNDQTVNYYTTQGNYQNAQQASKYNLLKISEDQKVLSQ